MDLNSEVLRQKKKKKPIEFMLKLSPTWGTFLYDVVCLIFF